MPNRKERDELDKLKKEMDALNEEMKKREQRNKLATERVRRQLEEAQRENAELEEEAAQLRRFLGKDDESMRKTDKKTTPSKSHASKASSNTDIFSFTVQPSDSTYGEQYRAQESRSNADYQPAKYAGGSRIRNPQEKNEKSYSNESEENGDPYDEEEEEDKEEEGELQDNEKYGDEGTSPNHGGLEDTHEEFAMRLQRRTEENGGIVSEHVGADNKLTREYESGMREVIFANGVRRERYADGYTVVHFCNGDVKQTIPEGDGNRVVYLFAEAGTVQTSLPDGVQVFRFSNGQVEKHYPDGTKEIHFTDGTVKCLFNDGEEESVFSDGTVQRVSAKDGL